MFKNGVEKSGRDLGIEPVTGEQIGEHDGQFHV